MAGVSASIDDRSVALVDISRRGVLLRMEQAPPVGSTGAIAIRAEPQRVTFTGQVVRVDTDPDRTGGFLVAMEFLSLTPVQVANLLRPLFAVLAGRRPSGEMLRPDCVAEHD